MSSVFFYLNNPFQAILVARLNLDNKEGKHSRNVYNIIGLVSDFGGLQ